MYIIIAGAGKVGWNLARELIGEGHEVTLIESDRNRYLTVEEELEHSIQHGDASELWVLERAGIVRADMVVAVTGDDEDNMLISQVAKEKYLVEHTIARVNNPRNLEHFELLGIRPVVSATDLILRLIEHEVPHHGLVHLLDLRQEQLEIIELEVAEDAPAAGKPIGELELPEGCLVVSVLRNGTGFVPKADTVIEAGDEVLAVLNPGDEPEVCQLFGAYKAGRDGAAAASERRVDLDPRSSARRAVPISAVRHARGAPHHVSARGRRCGGCRRLRGRGPGAGPRGRRRQGTRCQDR